MVAAYNVNAYQTGILKTVDVEYLGTLGSGAVPQIAKLLDDQNAEVAEAAQRVLNRNYVNRNDFRSWNFADWRAKPFVPEQQEAYTAETEDMDLY